MSSEALAKPIITRNSSEFKLDAYASIPAGELVVFAVQVLQADAAPVAVEEVVSICFRFFPHSFALKNYFYWPDSALVARRLHDAKEKGLLKGSTTDGFETKVQGRQVARHVAKALRVSLPMPPKVEVPEPVEKKEEEKKEEVSFAPVVKTVKKREALRLRSGQVRNEKVQQKQKAVKPEKKSAVKKQAAKPKAQAKPKKEAVKAAAPVKKKHAPKPKKTVKPAAKVKVQVKQKQTKPAPKPKPVVKAKVQVAKKRIKPVAKAKAEAPKKEQVKIAPKPKAQKAAQLTMSLTPPAAWKKAEASATKPKRKVEAPPTANKKPVKVEVLAPVAASKEEKVKAAKVIKQIERSDAYQLYRRNGKRAQIGEFDFRNMLFTTMESSAETLKRNVELFKRYAGIHFRTDLIAFLEFCEENFSALLMPKAKVKGKR